MGSTIFGGKILLKPVEEEKHEHDYGDEGILKKISEVCND